MRCWFAPHDLLIGDQTWDAIDPAMRFRDKLRVILSDASIASNWVKDEVNSAYDEERDRKVMVLFPIRIDDAVMNTPNLGRASSALATSAISASGRSRRNIRRAFTRFCVS